jgi:hypothetical protein
MMPQPYDHALAAEVVRDAFRACTVRPGEFWCDEYDGATYFRLAPAARITEENAGIWAFRCRLLRKQLQAIFPAHRWVLVVYAAPASPEFWVQEVARRLNRLGNAEQL